MHDLDREHSLYAEGLIWGMIYREKIEKDLLDRLDMGRLLTHIWGIVQGPHSNL